MMLPTLSTLHMTIRTYALLVLLPLSWPCLGMAQADDPRELVIGASQRLVDALKDKGDAIHADRQVAYQIAEDVVTPHIDFQLVGRWVLGQYWRTATPAQRERFTDEFRILLMRTYVAAMVEYSDQIVSHASSIRYLPTRSKPDDPYASVQLEISLPDRPPVQASYSLYRTDAGWKIYDVTVEGVSLVTTYRSSFANEIRRGGMDELIAKLASKNNGTVPQ